MSLLHQLLCTLYNEHIRSLRITASLQKKKKYKYIKKKLLILLEFDASIVSVCVVVLLFSEDCCLVSCDDMQFSRYMQVFRDVIFTLVFLLLDAEASGAGDNATSSYACCYNGCVNTCTKKLDPPIGETFHHWR